MALHRRVGVTRAVIAFAMLSALFVTLVAPPAIAAEPGERIGPAARTTAHRYRVRMLGLLNQMRSGHGLPQLRLNHPLSPESWEHSRLMARRDQLFHTPDLSALVAPFGATVWGENIGVAQTLTRLLRLMMASPPHREHLVDRRLRWIGIGVVRVRGWLWVTLDLHN